MPYIVDRKNKCVYKKTPSGNRGERVGCTDGSLKKYLAALYVNEKTENTFCCKEHNAPSTKLKSIYQKLKENRSK